MREATRIAGEGIVAAMRASRPGLREYELQAEADYVFRKNGAMGVAYFALVATGRNTYYTHYHRSTEVLRDGELVQFDYAPDYKYYQSDVTRVFPVNGRFTPRQREYYGIYLKLYQALLTSIAVHKTPGEVTATAVGKMDAIMAAYPFTDDRIKAAAATMVEGLRARKDPRGLGHNVGLEVHDVGGLQAATFEPGRVFTIEPQMRLEDEHLGVRLEDMILITETRLREPVRVGADRSRRHRAADGAPSPLAPGAASRPRRVERVVREDEQRAPVRAAEQELQRPLGHVDAADFLAVGRVDEHLAVGDVDAPVRTDRDALAAAVGERLQVGDRAAGADQAAVGRDLRSVGHEDARARAWR